MSFRASRQRPGRSGAGVRTESGLAAILDHRINDPVPGLAADPADSVLMLISDE